MIFDRATLTIALILFVAACLAGCGPFVTDSGYIATGKCMGCIGGALATLAGTLGAAYRGQSNTRPDTANKGA